MPEKPKLSLWQILAGSAVVIVLAVTGLVFKFGMKSQTLEINGETIKQHATKLDDHERRLTTVETTVKIKLDDIDKSVAEIRKALK